MQWFDSNHFITELDVINITRPLTIFVYRVTIRVVRYQKKSTMDTPDQFIAVFNNDRVASGVKKQEE